MEPLESAETELEDQRKVVLVVEDEFLIRWPTAEYLRDSGYRVIEAGSVDEAVMVLSSGTPLDVVFSDINLSEGLTGSDLARWLGEHHPGLPILLTSGGTNSVRAPADFIAKPYVLAEAEQRLRSLIARKRGPG
jgi:two-component system, response regulator PdtaR